MNERFVLIKQQDLDDYRSKASRYERVIQERDHYLKKLEELQDKVTGPMEINFYASITKPEYEYYWRDKVILTKVKLESVHLDIDSGHLDIQGSLLRFLIKLKDKVYDALVKMMKEQIDPETKKLIDLSDKQSMELQRLKDLIDAHNKKIFKFGKIKY